MSKQNGVHRKNGGTVIDKLANLRTFDEEEIKKSRRILRPKTDGQSTYFDMIDESVILFCGGVSGTGKTYIAVGKAIEMLNKGTMNKILLTRPVVECGKGLGFLPGEKTDKFRPYLRPFYDIFNDFLDPKEVEEYISKDIIEFMPLEYMRGNTFNRTVMIMDEAQNANEEQIKMFLTRIGYESKIIITGDTTQTDLYIPHEGKGKAFAEALAMHSATPYIDGVNVVTLTEDDIVRNDIIRKILMKYEKRKAVYS